MTTEVKRVVDAIDETRLTEHWRDPDRPDARVFRGRGRVAPEVVRAQTRLRTADWRNRMDRKRAPTSAEIGMSMVFALITSRMGELTFTDKDIVSRMLMDLQDRGFSVVEARATLRRLRNRYVDRGDRDGDAEGDAPF